jgi:hypothetical protein
MILTIAEALKKWPKNQAIYDAYKHSNVFEFDKEGKFKPVPVKKLEAPKKEKRNANQGNDS